ncbi:magnesium chelatase family protein [Clostridium tetanomorphum]|uniref:YifB family Mg chelatase-like AAA ATPase n=1 Tax=Clostridium tetanomorphum TaxID=1553 RepID=A0A923J2Q6_CLOTT|nr:YifB family Mg chelatase-like AAA ATPase [Clostridium tetanomorphum]KAJ51549.1 Mg(2+) chelatase family protein [Clostridium tetanomorphum DSM 665]MBC2398903.1 YifB family Mg chelatase-like AAA ATPase [Clostridium tetanomorphum]MBP1865198.1 magnesium chelatase family protein [Clostridium tetanomorphum]NRS84663.1 magnesium chelatase family protein [Clostridium tetanomorphum]NRZ97878.1 magnesium chelatase family protein [Clostridium tetanomorphum]
MAVKINTATFTGIEGIMIDVEVDISRGLPCFNIVGMPNIAVKESKERVRAAIINSGFEFPVGRITINLAPADLKKEGSLFDLPIAIGILLATNQIKIDNVEKYIFMGELSLLGELRMVKGALPIVIEGIKNNIYSFIVPLENKDECSIIKEAKVYPLSNLNEVVGYLKYKDLLPYKNKYKFNILNKYSIDFSDILSQESAKRAVEVAAAGNHNIILYGPPGTGKTMIAKRIPTILPDITYKEALECTKIYSVVGALKEKKGLIVKRPFRDPHHTASKISLVGGGINLNPGEVSLAHNGVLFLDELLEFKKDVLESLRQPLENRKIKISKSSGTVEYPCNFMLVGALNPCPCSKIPCECSELEKRRYINKLSGPLLDRIDIFTPLSKLEYREIKSTTKGENSKTIKKRIDKARKIQKERFKSYSILTNGEMNGEMIMKYCKLKGKAASFMEKVYDKFNFSTRVYTRILKVSRTIADLEEKQDIEEVDLIEALQYRKFLDNIV